MGIVLVLSELLLLAMRWARTFLPRKQSPHLIFIAIECTGTVGTNPAGIILIQMIGN